MVLIPLLMAVLLLPRLYLSALAFPGLLYRSVISATDVPNYSAPELNAISGSHLVQYLLPILSGALFAAALFNTLPYLPGVGGRDHSRYDYVVGVLAPLVGAVLTFLMFDSLYYLGKDYVEYSNLRSVVSWTILPCLAAWALHLLLQRRSIGARLRLAFGPLSLAVAAMAAGTGAATWPATNYLLWSPDPQQAPTWATYVTIGPPTFLLGFKGNVIDSVHYSDKWHNDNFISTKDISLERINRNLGANDPNNWRSSVTSIGATPGKQNSIYTVNPNIASNISVSPNPFSPDDDGFEDFTFINYNLTQATSQVRIKIFDNKGRLVRTLANNQASGSSGSIIFDGIGDDGQALRIGIYIIFLEAINEGSGVVESMKTVVVVARKL